MKSFILFLALFAMTSCKQKIPAVIPPQQISLVIGNPVNVGLKDVLLFPVGGNYNPKITAGAAQENSANSNGDLNNDNVSYLTKNGGSFKYDRSATDEYINAKEEAFDIRNLLFYNKLNGKTYPLATDSLHILSFAIHNEFKKPHIFFRIVKKDINGDKKFNSKDAVILFVSDPDGKNLVQITPENEQFFDYFYYPETQTILVKTAIDIDKSKTFTSQDETNFREMKLDSPAFGREIFTQGLKDSLRALMK